MKFQPFYPTNVKQESLEIDLMGEMENVFQELSNEIQPTKRQAAPKKKMAAVKEEPAKEDLWQLLYTDKMPSKKATNFEE